MKTLFLWPGEGNGEIFERCLYFYINLCHFRSPLSFSPSHKLHSVCDSPVVCTVPALNTFHIVVSKCFIGSFLPVFSGCTSQSIFPWLYLLFLGDLCSLCIICVPAFCLPCLAMPAVQGGHDGQCEWSAPAG